MPPSSPHQSLHPLTRPPQCLHLRLWRSSTALLAWMQTTIYSTMHRTLTLPLPLLSTTRLHTDPSFPPRRPAPNQLETQQQQQSLHLAHPHPHTQHTHPRPLAHLHLLPPARPLLAPLRLRYARPEPRPSPSTASSGSSTRALLSTGSTSSATSCPTRPCADAKSTRCTRPSSRCRRRACGFLPSWTTFA